MRKTVFSLLLLAVSASGLRAQEPSLFLSNSDFAARKQIAARKDWAGKSLATLVKEADDFPASYMQRFKLQNAAPPPEGGQWLHWYACPQSGHPLEYQPPDKNICPDTGKNFTGYPYDHVVYQLRNDALGEAAVASGLAFRFTGRKAYAEKAAAILKDYAQVYPTYTLHDINGKAGPNGGLAFAQTLDESIWLIKIAWTYDLVRGAGVLTETEKQDIETKVLRAGAAIVLKAHKEPTYNIQSWINGAAAAVGFTLNDQALIHEAIDGPIGFRYQMHTFVHEGFWAEGAWGYQFYAMRPLTMLAQMASRKGISLWKEEPNLVALFHSPVGVVLPDGRLPAFNDSGSPDLYEENFLYEVAYTATHDPALLTVIDHGARSDREAFLFGVEDLPASAASKSKSAIFPEAGYATLRSDRNDLTVVIKFGPHGGAHGHYDKLNFILFAKGQTLGIDPGAHPYGLPIHKEWDSMTIAHNTVSVDQQRQAQATGKLLGWESGDGWSAVSASAGSAYGTASLRRTMLLTPDYVLIVDRDEALDGKQHAYDWAYHNLGIASTALAMKPFQFEGGNGYQHLANTRQATTSDGIAIRFHTEPPVRSEHAEKSNSTPATYRYQTAALTPAKLFPVDLDLQMIAADGSEVVTGNSPARDTPSPVSFVVVRRKGKSATFATLLQVSSGASARLVLKALPSGGYSITGPHGSDTFSDVGKLTFHHSGGR